MGKPSRKRRNPRRSSCHTPLVNPHSSAWFEAMLEVNACKAMITGSIVDKAGRLDVCSICGDEPAPIYDRLVAPHLPVRLCRTCLTIREGAFDEHYQPRLASPEPEP